MAYVTLPGAPAPRKSNLGQTKPQQKLNSIRRPASSVVWYTALRT